ncbi:DeoR family transcriptional regulator [Pleomorphomonas diazotrophica]|uniref:DeoR family transcriptional regulator n=1 Tax=Pleomorphomonas diazotrophica TaxID=1166257 RepID=A0A1I4SDZ8_9HYPH|nr:DeoR/GlpR family DNA-binding transcription regulator [Pleomorphomonas diazotrophica]PKR88877.1 DeoR family transcriptional regulator [Pleomorphomonas diazotrophica]SFM62503.1 DNA-binding transcriptional regulator of sugar metabolism, DeoR/GlpR family [Pleomorphomonas diazotrophica]
MLTSERKALIQQVLRQEGRLVAKDFSQKLGVSEDTIRRDLRELAGEGLLQRVHGGALPASSAVADFASREQVGSSVKAKLGQAAARMIQPGQIVFLDGGTTNVQLARHLPSDLKAVVITHSPSIAVELVRHPHVEVELIGGRLFKHSIVAVGATSAEAISRIRADLFFMGATGVHPETGVTTGDREEAAIKALIARQSAETIVLATEEKLGAASPYQIMPLSDIGTLVTVAGLPEETLRSFRSSGLALVEV